MSGKSALNMRPDPIPEEEQDPNSNGYLSDVDYYVKHAYEHFSAASDALVSYQHWPMRWVPGSDSGCCCSACSFKRREGGEK